VRLLRMPASRARVRAWVEALERRRVIGPAIDLVMRRGERPARFVWHRVTPGDLGLELTTTTASFPSAHVAHSLAWVAIAVAVARVLPGWGARAGAVVFSVVLVVAVALTRMYLRVHYLSDVVAGAGLGAACFALCAVGALLVGHVRHTVRAR